MKLAEHNRVRLIWVSGHVGNDGNEIADQQAREGFLHPLIDPEAAFGISAAVARGVIGAAQAGNSRSFGSPHVDKGKLKDFLKKLLRGGKKLGNRSV